MNAKEYANRLYHIDAHHKLLRFALRRQELPCLSEDRGEFYEIDLQLCRSTKLAMSWAIEIAKIEDESVKALADAHVRKHIVLGDALRAYENTLLGEAQINTVALAKREVSQDTMDCIAGLTYAPTCEQIMTWARAYPGVDVPAEIRKIKAWIMANPTRRKTARGMPKFINSWLARANDSKSVARDKLSYQDSARLKALEFARRANDT